MMTETKSGLSNPTSWPSAASSDVNDMIPIATIVASVSALGVTDGGATVATPTERLPIVTASNPRETPTNTKRHTAAIHCENCGREFLPRRPHGCFCSAYCRRVAWLSRNPEKAAKLAERDRQRLRAHVIGCGGEWVDRCHNGA